MQKAVPDAFAVLAARYNILDNISDNIPDNIRLSERDLVFLFANLSRNPTMRMQFILDNPDRPWDWDQLSANIGITLADIKLYSQFPWSWNYICENPNIRIQFVLDHQDMPLSWFAISQNPGIRLRDICAHGHLPWCWAALSRNPNMRFAFVRRHLDKPWCWVSLSKNPGITMAAIASHPCLPWAWSHISSNVNVTLQFVQEHMHRPWHWDFEALSANPGLQASEAFSHKLSERLDRFQLAQNACAYISDMVGLQPGQFCHNAFVAERRRLVDQYAREHMAAIKIQRTWRAVVLDPAHSVGHRIQLYRFIK